MENVLDKNATERYARQLLLKEIGEQGQQKLARAKVLVIGTGGLGSPVSLYLASAGVGTIGIADCDTVDWSNLNRQILYDESQIGLEKIECAAEALRKHNSSITVKTHNMRIVAENVLEIVKEYDIVIDACDNFATRYIVSDATEKLCIPYIHGAINGFEGHVSLFNYGPSPISYRSLWPDQEYMLQIDKAKAASGNAAAASGNTYVMELSEAEALKGVVGVTAGIVGIIEATQAIKLICGFGELLNGKLFTIDLRSLETQIIAL